MGGWWDGPARYHHVNRNIVSVIQREALFDLVKKLCSRNIEHANFGVEIGGPGGPEGGCLGLDVFQSDAHNQIVGDGNCLPFKDNSLDYILSTASIEHIPGDPTEIFQEWIRALRPKGMICCFAPDVKLHGKHANHPEHPDWQAPNDHTREEWKSYIDQLENVKIIQFGTLENEMFINIVLMKT